MNPFVQNVAGGIAANEVQRGLDSSRGKPDQHLLFERLHTTICEVLGEIRELAENARRENETPFYKGIVLQQEKRVEIETRGMRYNRIWFPNNTTQVSVKFPVGGIGGTFTSDQGWNALDFPDKTEIWLTSGNDQNVLFCAANYPLGSNTL